MVVKIKKIIQILFIPMFLIFASINYGCSPAGVLATGGGSAMVVAEGERSLGTVVDDCLLYTSPSPRDKRQSRMPSSA